MKKFYLFLIALLMSSGAIAQSAQPCSTCLPEGMHFNTQAQIDNFQTDYPNCTEILGDVAIGLFAPGDITNLNGLNVLTSVGGDLFITSNDVLTSLTGLESLTSIGGDLNICFTHTLTSLTGLNNLTSIGGDLGVDGNDVLTSLTGLDSIESNTITSLYIAHNSLLSTCAIQSICDYLASPTGTIEIFFNSTGCNSHAQVDSACVYLSNGFSYELPSFSIYPNLSSKQITISTPTTPDKNTFITIYNIDGQILLSRQITEQKTVVDLSWLSQGIYFVRVNNNRTVKVGKFVKQ